MRWLVALALAGCASSDGSYEEAPPSTMPTILLRLREAQGEGRLIAGDRYYIVREDALQDEMRAFARAIAAALEAGDATPEEPLPAASGETGVIALPWLSRALQVGDLAIESIRGDRGTRWVVTFRAAPGRYFYRRVRATSSTEATWDLLAARARMAGIPWLCGENVHGGFWLFEWGVDVRGTGAGSWPAPDDAP